MMKKSRALFIRGGRVLSDGMAVDRPAPQDILIEDGVIRAIRVGMRADLTLLDFSYQSFVPLNSALRQVVFTECGRAVDTVIVDGRVLLQDKRMLFVDEAALRRDVETAMEVLRGDINDVVTCNDKLAPYMAEAHRLTSYHPLEMTRYVPSLAETDLA
jgi:5-methylthioadenosine/S-adenosylhomocysteine deaminase